jgi:hypothetical protein
MSYKKNIDYLYDSIFLDNKFNTSLDYSDIYPFLLPTIQDEVNEEPIIIQNLKDNKYFNIFAKYLKKRKIDCLIMGYTLLNCTIKFLDLNILDMHFEINIVDTNSEKITQLDNVIRNIFPPDYKIIVVRTIDRLEWVVFDREDKNCLNVSTNIFQFENYDQIMILQPSNLLAIGYSVLDHKIFIQTRWINSFVFENGDIFVNIDNYHNLRSNHELSFISEQLSKLSLTINIKLLQEDEEESDIIFMKSNKAKNICWHLDNCIRELHNRYGHTKNVAFLTNIKNVFGMRTQYIPPARIISLMKEKNHSFLLYPYKISSNIIERDIGTNLMIKNRVCNHSISLHNFFSNELFKSVECYEDECLEYLDPQTIYDMNRILVLRI